MTSNRKLPIRIHNLLELNAIKLYSSSYGAISAQSRRNFTGYAASAAGRRSFDCNLVYQFASLAHEGQVRANGSPYLSHPARTAMTLAEWGLDATTVAAGLLHDVPEDTTHTIDEIRQLFGKDVAKLVNGITKLGVIKYRGLERYAENLRKMFVAMADDIRVILIKFADRLDNLKTLNVLPPFKQQRIAKESIEIYGAIANRLGMGELRGEIEDAAFPYADPEGYAEIEEIMRKKLPSEQRYLESVRLITEKAIKETGISILSLTGRVKHRYSLYRKLQRHGGDLSKIYDLIALRLVVPTMADCYLALGVLHRLWTPLKGRIKDYIAQPKPNGYRSLHTTVFADKGHIVEFQIRDKEMQEQAEFGLAAHWHYKEDGVKHLNRWQKEWLRQLKLWQQEAVSSEQYLEGLHLDLFSHHIFVFTPKGDVIDLPEGATPIDFAYHIHTEVGDSCIGARVNTMQVPLNHRLQSGDVVEIVTNKGGGKPKLEWLNNTVTNQAKGKIKHSLKGNNRNLLRRLLPGRTGEDDDS